MATDSLTVRNDENNLQSSEETRSGEQFIKPAVSIFETENGLTLTADLPGASRDTLEVNVEKGILTISATAVKSMLGTPSYAEFTMGSYYRQFTIPESLDHAKAAADFTNGVLVLRVPRAEQAKPRKIDIKVA